MKLLVATRSSHKLREIRRILNEVPGLRVLGLEAVGVPYDPREEELEPYETFEENARSKAAYFRERTGLPTVADDSGLVVDALDGAPGVRSKRFAPADDLDGAERDAANNEHLLDLLGDTPLSERTAAFICVAALDRGERGVEVFRGEAPGLILGHPRGRGGFGYDPLFFDRTLGETFAEISEREKNRRSHRGRAFRGLAEFLQKEGREGEERSSSGSGGGGT